MCISQNRRLKTVPQYFQKIINESKSGCVVCEESNVYNTIFAMIQDTGII